MKAISELFLDATKPNLELSEFSARGIEYLLEVNERRFIPWRSIITVGALASLQMALGGALVATGFGATVGTWSYHRRVSQYIDCSEDISYSTIYMIPDYCKQKASEVLPYLLSMGMQALKDAGTGIKNIAVD